MAEIEIIEAVPRKDPIELIGIDELVEGGIEGAANKQAIAIANNLKYLDDISIDTWSSKVDGYKLHSIVILDSGDIVKTVIPNNTANPNIDMSGWVLDDTSVNALKKGIKNDGVTSIKNSFGDLVNSLNDGDTLVLPKGRGEYFWDASSGTLDINKNISIVSDGAVIRVKGFDGYSPFISFNNSNPILSFPAVDVLHDLKKGAKILNVKNNPVADPAEYFVFIDSTEVAIHRPLFVEDYVKKLTIDFADNNYTLRNPMPFGFDDLSKVTLRFVKKEYPAKLSGFRIIPTDDHPVSTYYLQFSYKSRLTIDDVVVDTKGRQSQGVLFHYNRCCGVTTLLSGGRGANKGDVNFNTYVFSQSASSYLKWDRCFYNDTEYKDKSTKGIGGRNGFRNHVDSCLINGVDDHWGHDGLITNMNIPKGITWAGGGLVVENCHSIDNLVQLRTDTPFADGILKIKDCTSATSLLNAYGHQWPSQVAGDFCTHKVWNVVDIDGTYDLSKMSAAVVLIKEPNIKQSDVFRNTVLKITGTVLQSDGNKKGLLEFWAQSGLDGLDVPPLVGDLNLKKLFGLIFIDVLNIVQDSQNIADRPSLIIGGVADEYIIKSNNISFQNLRADIITINDSSLIDTKTVVNTLACNTLYLNNFKFKGGKNIWPYDVSRDKYPNFEVHLLNPHAQHQNIIASMFGSAIKSSRGGVFRQGWKTAQGWDLVNYDRDFCVTYTVPSSGIVVPPNGVSAELSVDFVNANYDSFIRPLFVYGNGDIFIDLIRKKTTGVEYKTYFKFRNTSASQVTIPEGTTVKFKVV